MAQQLSEIPNVIIDDRVTFAELTTLRLGGRPKLTVRALTTEALTRVVSLLDAAGVPLILVGGGSNLVVADGELDLVAVLVEADGVDIDATTGLVRAAAGVTWDDLVAATIEAGLGGVECLSGIPGSVGATPVQNVGAYGAEVGDVLTRVRLFDRAAARAYWVPVAALDLAYRYSNLKFTSRAVVLEVELQLRTDGLSAPLRFGELARRLGASVGEQRFPAGMVRQAVLELRGAKGMVLAPDDFDTWSAGSFFTNPVVPAELAERVQELVRQRRGDEDADRMPRFAAGEGKEKLSAAWLIERAGYPKGYPAGGAAALSSKHTLALSNRGAAATADLVALAREVRDGVRAAFGVTLEPEPVWVKVAIDEE